MKFIKYLFTQYKLKWVIAFALFVSIGFGVHDIFYYGHVTGVPQYAAYGFILFVFTATTIWELISNRKLQRKPWNR